jgi:initiation factor 1A
VPINEITPDNKTRFVAQVSKNLGSYRVEVETYPTNDSYNTLIPGSFRKRIWINIADYVLIEVSAEITGNNCFIIHKYDSNEIDELVELGHLTLKHKDVDGDNNFQFQEESDGEAEGGEESEFFSKI